MVALDLHGGTGYDVEVGVRGSAVHIALVAEDIGRAPQQFDTRLLLFLFQVGYDFLQIGFVFLDGVGLGTEVHVVEAVVLDTHLLHEFKTGVHLVLGSLHGISRVVPRESLRAAAELVTALGAQRVPPGHGELQPFAHFLAHDDLVGVVIAERHGVLTLFTFKLNLSYARKILFCCHNLSDVL